MNPSRTATRNSEVLARIEGKVDRLLAHQGQVRADLADLQTGLRRHDATADRVVAAPARDGARPAPLGADDPW